jgi:hypothetical protein
MADYAFAIASFVFLLLLSFIFLQVTTGTNPFLVLITFSILINVCAAAGGHLFIPTLRYWHHTPAFFLLVLVAIFCLGAAFSSVSLQTLQVIAQGGGRTTIPAMHRSVVKENLLKRLEEHVAAGRLRRSGETYYLTEDGRSLIAWSDRLKDIFSIRQAGIY